MSLPKPSDTSRPSIRTGKTARFPPLIIAKDYERQTEALEEAIEWLQAEKQEVGNGVNVENPLLCDREPRKLRRPAEISAGGVARRKHPANPSLGDPAGTGPNI